MMSEPSRQISIEQKIWVAARFTLFGCAGFLALMFGSVAFAIEVVEKPQHVMNWFFSLPVAFIGAFMMLFGVGKWGNWAYLLVFLSIPVSFLASLFAFTVLFSASEKSLGSFVVTGVVALLINAGVDVYYEEQKLEKLPSELNEHEEG